MSRYEVRGAFGFDEKANSDAAAILIEGESLAVQADAADADINNIVKRWMKTGVMPAAARLPQYGDFTGPGSYTDALAIVAGADEAFDALPSDVRYRFGNDPAVYVAFASDPANAPEMVRMGLLDGPPPAEVPEVPQPPSAAS